MIKQKKIKWGIAAYYMQSDVMQKANQLWWKIWVARNMSINILLHRSSNLPIRNKYKYQTQNNSSIVCWGKKIEKSPSEYQVLWAIKNEISMQEKKTKRRRRSWVKTFNQVENIWIPVQCKTDTVYKPNEKVVMESGWDLAAQNTSRYIASVSY